MVNSNANALGILFPNSYDSLVPELVSERLMASIPFASRYRLVDFILSSMVNCGIDNISLIVRKNYHSLMDHLGSGRAWDLVRKNGGLNLVPPFAEKTVKVYSGRVEALASILDFLKEQREQYVIMADTNLAVNFDFGQLIKAHQESGADVTIAYTCEELPKSFTKSELTLSDLYYTLDIDDGRVTQLKINSREAGPQNFSMNIYVMDRERLIDLVSEAFVRGHVYFERDILAPQLDKLHVCGYRYDGYVARISSVKSYFDENMKMLDDNPARYMDGCTAKNIMAADGCIIEGEVENSVLFRGVKIGKGAKVKNCVLMQDTVVEAGAVVENVVTDKDVTITSSANLKGTDTFPVYVPKYQTV